jgi:Holliday junction DNA helicase RuvA
MIGRLRGMVAEVEAEDCLIDVMGVGYQVRCGARTLGRLPAVGEETVLLVEHAWSAEQGPRLYGFLSRDERAAYRLLTGIQGVGPKAALSVLDILPPAELAQAVARADQAAVGRANGVGPKLAQRIVVELKGKPLGGGLTIGAAGMAGGMTAAVAPVVSISGDAVAGMMGLGIAEALARRAIDHVLATEGPDVDLSTLIKLSLKELGR